MKNPTEFELNHRRWAVRLALTTGLAMLFLAALVLSVKDRALLWGLQGLTPAHADPGTLYVDGATGSDDSDCSDPADPCGTIGYALSQAGNGDDIRVAEGIYTETLDIAITVKLKGGYTMSGTLWLPGTGETVVDANGADAVVFTIGPGNQVTVEGFTVQGANNISGEGGGFFINGANVVISDTVIRDNATDSTGGGVWIENGAGTQGAHVSLINSTVAGNSAGGGSGGLMVGDHGPIPVTLENTVFTGNAGDSILGLDRRFEIVGGQVISNTVTGYAAIQIGGSGSGTISGTEIVSNTSSAMGIASANNVVSAHNLTIRGNTGGGIVSGGGLTLTDSLIEKNSGGWFLITSVNEGAPGTERVTLDGCTIRGNSDTPGIVGLSGRAQVRDTVIEGNDSVAKNGDVINISRDAVQVDLVNVLLADNESTRPVVNGNAATSTISLMNVTLAGNSVVNFPVLAGEGVWTVTNTIVWGNSAPDEMLGLGTFSVNYSDIEGGWEGGTGNLDADPRFVDAANHDYRLAVDSPCVDTGTPTGAPAADIEGTPRDAAPDMGAYEWTGHHIFLPLTLSSS